MMNRMLASLLALALWSEMTVCVRAADNITPDEALGRLMEGNSRFASGKPRHPDESLERRVAEAKTQHPFAIVIGCSDSRVPPELVFDQGLGDLFVVRTAGNRLDDLVLASVEYGVEHLGCSLVVVLGHKNCGAVASAIEADAELAAGHAHEASPPDHLPQLMGILHDAVSQAKGQPGDAVENAVLENIRIVTADLPKQSPVLAQRVEAGTLKVIGLRYDLDSGLVTTVKVPVTKPHSAQ